MIVGNAALGLGLLSLFISGPWSHCRSSIRIGGGLLVFGLSWFSCGALISYLAFHRAAWWALIPGGLGAGTGGAFLCLATLQFVDVVLISWWGWACPGLPGGCDSRLFGLFCAGSLLLGIAPGVYVLGHTAGIQQPGAGWASCGVLRPGFG
jgi:hypothetical protein